MIYTPFINKYKLILFVVKMLLILGIVGLQVIKPSNSTFETNLSQIKLKDSIFSTLADIYKLIGKTKQDIENEYTYHKQYQREYGHYVNNELVISKVDLFMIDKCTLIYYENDKVSQISMGSDILDTCINPEYTFDKATRLNLLGKEELVRPLVGSGITQYYYTSNGIVLLKGGTHIFQIWFGDKMSINDYQSTFELNRSKFRLNSFTYSIPFDPSGAELKHPEEE